MERVEEIEAAISSLPRAEYRRLVDWIVAREQAPWDEQLDRAPASGGPDFLFAEAETEAAQDLVRTRHPQN